MQNLKSKSYFIILTTNSNITFIINYININIVSTTIIIINLNIINNKGNITIIVINIIIVTVSFATVVVALL